jgi:predicted MFS family arabinose efflux permease
VSQTGSAGFGSTRFLAVSSLTGLALGMTAPITVLYASTFGASDAVAGLAWSSIGVSLLLVDLFGTQVIPRLNARTLLWMALSVFAAGLVISGLAPNLGVMIAGRVIQGGAAAFCLGGALQVVVRFSPPDETGKAIGTFNAAWFAGVALGPLLGGGIADIGGGQFGYRLAFVVNAGLCVTAAVVARVSLPPIPAIGRPRIGLPRRAFARPGLRMWPVLALGMLGDGLRGGLVFTAIPLFGEDRLGLQPAAIGLALSAFAVVDIVSMRFGGMLADRVGPRRVLGGALLAGAITCACAPLVTSMGGFVVWCAALGVPMAVSWVVPAAMVVDVSESSEQGLATYRIAADAGEITGSTTAGALTGAAGNIGALVVFGGVLAFVAAWVSQLREAQRRTVPATASA